MPKDSSGIGRSMSRRIRSLLDPGESGDGSARELEEARRELRRRDEEISRLKASLDGRGQAATGSRAGLDVRNIVWVFGAGRTGSTWLAAMVDELNGQTVWFEPRIGVLFDPHKFDLYKGKHFILSDHYRQTWLDSIRSFTLAGAEARFPDLGADDYLVIKEPSGSVGATWLAEATPESRMVLLVRDPRDFAASWLDAHREGGWQHARRQKDWRRSEAEADADPDAFVRRQAQRYLHHIGSSKKAYDAHRGPKTLVRYEDLRSDTLATMERMYSELSVSVDGGALSRSVEKHSWEGIPADQKGEGKFYRKATPGGWREDLTGEQARIVEEITGPLIEAFYPSGTA